MPTIKISEKNKSELDRLLALKIGYKKSPSITMDDVITDLLAGQTYEYDVEEAQA